MAQPKSAPAATVAGVQLAPVPSVTVTGVGDEAVDPLPSCPDSPKPQHAIAPVARAAQVCVNPVATAVASPRPTTPTGVSALDVPPLPSSPFAPHPQQTTW